MQNQYTPLFDNARHAARRLLQHTDAQRSAAILALADILDANHAPMLAANAADLDRMDPANPLYDRLQLTDARLDAIAADLRNVAGLKTPVGTVDQHRTLPNGIDLQRVRVPYGVVGVIYEARPNVTFDVFALCLKSGNAALLKGGRDADESNRAAIALIHRALQQTGLPRDTATLMPSTHQATEAMLTAAGKIDVCIPRGGRRLIDFVRDNAKVPVIETGAGVVHAYIDKTADPRMAARIIDNAKTRRVSVCNALDTLLVHRGMLDNLPAMLKTAAGKKVTLHADPRAMQALRGKYPDNLLTPATEADKDREWMSMHMGVFTVGDTDQAIAHIAAHGSGHSETIVTADTGAAEKFANLVDASCVYVNLPTSFTDGAQFGLGAEIGISTQKLGPRGPMGLTELTTTKYLLHGNGQTRP